MGALAKVRGGQKTREARSHKGQLQGSARKKLNRGVLRKETSPDFSQLQALREEAERKLKADVARATKPKTNPRPLEVEWVPVLKTWQ